jgi:hypothetical protein
MTQGISPFYMKKSYLTNLSFLSIIIFCGLFVSCTKDTEKTTEKSENSSNVKLTHSKNDSATTDTQKNKNGSDSQTIAIEEKQEKTLTPQQQLIQSLGKGAKIEFSPPDFEVLKTDTLIQSKQNSYQISFATACQNDSLIAQETFNYDTGYEKGYRISHNYKTNIAIKKNGQTTGLRLIDKEIFKNKLDREFLAKSIIKHPQFIRFDEEKNEAVFEFLVGVPSTDWVIVAGVNLSTQGQVRIIEILMPEMN